MHQTIKIPALESQKLVESSEKLKTQTSIKEEKISDLPGRITDHKKNQNLVDKDMDYILGCKYGKMDN